MTPFPFCFRCAKRMKTLEDILTKCLSCSGFVLFVLSIVPVVFALISELGMNFENLVFTPLVEYFILETGSILDQSNTLFAEFIAFLCIVPCFFFIICVVEFGQCCFVTFIRGLRPNERRTDMRTFFFYLLVFLTAYVPIACLHFQYYYYLKHFSISPDDFGIDSADEIVIIINWNKTQVFFECCGFHNYTYWGQSIPYSCCRNPQIPHCAEDLSNVYQKGCAQDISNFMTDLVRCRTSNTQVYCFAVGVVLLLIGITSLHFARKSYCGSFRCVEPVRVRVGHDNEYQPLIGDNVRGNENRGERLVVTQACASYMTFNVPHDNTYVRDISDDSENEQFFDVV